MIRYCMEVIYYIACSLCSQCGKTCLPYVPPLGMSWVAELDGLGLAPCASARVRGRPPRAPACPRDAGHALPRKRQHLVPNKASHM